MAHPTRLTPARRDPRGFTLIEMLVVISIITLIVLIAIPSFKALTGGRSVDAAANNLAAIVGRARTEAIGLQRTTGVLFYMDQASDRVAAIIVREVPPPPNSTAPPGTVYLDVTPNGESTLLPPGVGLNTFDNSVLGTGTPGNQLRSDDGLIGFNPVFRAPSSNFNSPIAVSGSGVSSRCGGAILFDGAGRLAVRPYRLLLNDDQSTPANAVNTTELAKLLIYDRNFTTTDTMGKTCSGTTIETTSSVGFVLFDAVQFKDSTTVSLANGTARTYAATERDGTNGNLATMPEDEKSEEMWIDQNGTPFLIARHSGGLLRNR